jgi:hypothetical protein
VIGLIGVAAHLLLGDPDDVIKPMPAPRAAQIEVQAAPVAVAPPPAPALEPAVEIIDEPAEAQVPAELVAAPVEKAVELVPYQLAIRPSGTVYVDGKKQGATPALKTLELTPGKHRIKVVNPGFPDYAVTVNVKAGQPGTITHHFAASSLF